MGRPVSRLFLLEISLAAARVKLDLFWGLVLGGSARWDRGYNPSGFGVIVPGSARPDTLDIEVTTGGGTLDTLATPGVSYLVDSFQGWEEWWGVGTDLQWIDLIGEADFMGEVLIGKSRATGRDGGMRNRVFLVHNIHNEQPMLMQTRWVMSYLRGPLTKPQVSALMADRKAPAEATTPVAATPQLRTPSLTVAPELKPVAESCTHRA